MNEFSTQSEAILDEDYCANEILYDSEIEIKNESRGYYDPDSIKRAQEA